MSELSGWPTRVLKRWVPYHDLDKFCLLWATWFCDRVSQVEVNLQIHRLFCARKAWFYDEKRWSTRLVQTWDVHADSQLSWCCFSEADWRHLSYGLKAWKKHFWVWTEREEYYHVSSSGHKDPSSAQIFTGEACWLCRAQQMLLFRVWKHTKKPAQSFGCHQKLKTELNNPEWNFFSTLCTFITKTRPIGHVGQTASLHKHAVRWSEWHHRDKWIRQSSDLRLLVFLPTMWENNVWL